MYMYVHAHAACVQHLYVQYNVDTSGYIEMILDVSTLVVTHGAISIVEDSVRVPSLLSCVVATGTPHTCSMHVAYK